LSFSGFAETKQTRPSSSLTNLKKEQDLQDISFSSESSFFLFPIHFFETTQHILPPTFPLFSPSAEISVATGHTPNLSAFSPPNSLPQFINSQQFTFCEGSSFCNITKLLLDK